MQSQFHPVSLCFVISAVGCLGSMKIFHTTVWLIADKDSQENGRTHSACGQSCWCHDVACCVELCLIRWSALCCIGVLLLLVCCCFCCCYCTLMGLDFLSLSIGSVWYGSRRHFIPALMRHDHAFATDQTEFGLVGGRDWKLLVKVPLTFFDFPPCKCEANFRHENWSRGPLINARPSPWA